MEKTGDFYEKKLGFKQVKYLGAAEKHICLYRDGIEIILTQANAKAVPNRKLYGYGYDAYIYTDSRESLQEEFIGRGVKIVRPLAMTDYQNKEFIIEDIDGRWIAFGLKVR